MFTFLLRGITLWFVCFVLRQLPSVAFAESAEHFNAKHSLVSNLTKNSRVTKEILPSTGLDSPVDLKIDLALRQIASVDEKNQAIRLTVWLRLSWNNPYLRWDPEDYQGIQNVHINSDLFWIPDISLFNEASLNQEIEILYKRLATKLIIVSDGNCSWNAPATLLSQCKIDVSRFPFDAQECHVSFGSWTYSGYQINVSYLKPYADLTHFIPNGEWAVQGATLHNELNHYGPEKIPFPVMTLKLRIKRRPLYYGLNLIIPCALISLLSFFSFLLPTDHGERVTLVITVLLANSVYMLIISSSLPETSDAVPILGVYCLGIIVEIAFCLLATCFTIKVRAMTGPIPHWMEKVMIKHFARLVFVNVESTLPWAKENGGLSFIRSKENSKKRDEKNLNSHAPNFEALPSPKREEFSFEFEENVLAEIRLITEEMSSRQDEAMLAVKWKLVAKILDRIFFATFFLIYVCLNSYLFAST